MRKYIKLILITIIFLFIFSLGMKSEIVEISDNIYSKDPYVLPFDNKVMVIWAEEVSGVFDLHYRICLEGVWGPKTRFNTGIYNSIYPQLELAPDGKVHVVWMGKIGEARAIYHAHYTDGVWSTPEEVYPSTRRSCWPRLGITSDGTLCSVWTQAEGSNDQNTIHFSFKSSSWLDGRLTNTPDTTSIHADLYARGDKIYACWMDAEGPYIWNLWFSQKQWGSNWTSPGIVASRYAQFPAMAVDSKGDVHSIFFGGGGETPYYINRVNGSWSSAVQLPYLGKFTKSFVYLDVDKWDYLHAVWRQEHNGIDDIGYVIRDEQGNWGTPEYVSNSSAATGVGASKPLVRVDNNGYAHIVWLDRRSESIQDEGKIYYNSVQYKADPHTLNVYSAPFFEVPITVSPVDINGYGDGNTNFTRTYDVNTFVTLTTPEIFSGKIFERWIIDETNNYSRTINVTMDNEHSVVAIYQTDDIVVMLPNGGENWEAYTIQDIYWLTPSTVTDVKIEYSIDNGTGWNDVVASTVNDGIYKWTVPNTPSTQCLIKISDISPDGPPPDTSDAVFTISVFTSASSFIKDGSWTGEGHGADDWYIGDYNGDGKPDIFRYMPGTSGADVFLSDSTRFVYDGSWTGAGHGIEGWYVGDFNGDGKSDIFRYMPGTSGADVFLSDGIRFVYDGSWTGAGHGIEGWYVGDFNGDGMDDIFRYIPGTSGADVFLSDGAKFVYDGSWTKEGHGTEGWYIGDFNGDGKVDIFRYMPGTSGADVFLSDGAKFVYDGSWTKAGHGTEGWYIGDFNGDGKVDIFRYMPGISGADVFLSDGIRFVYDGSWTGAGHGTEGWYVGDFDGDSDFDIFRYNPGVSGAEVFLAKYSGATTLSFYGYDILALDNNMIESQDMKVREELSFEEEEQIIERFKLKLYSGELPNIYEIKRAFEKKMNRRVRRVKIINILSKHGYWELIKENKNIKIKDRIAPEKNEDKCNIIK